MCVNTGLWIPSKQLESVSYQWKESKIHMAPTWCFGVVLLHYLLQPLELTDISMQLESWLCPSEGQLAPLTLWESEGGSERKQIKWQGSMAEFRSASVQGPLLLTPIQAWQLKMHASMVWELSEEHIIIYLHKPNPMQMDTAIQCTVSGQMHACFIFLMHLELMADQPLQFNEPLINAADKWCGEIRGCTHHGSRKHINPVTSKKVWICTKKAVLHRTPQVLCITDIRRTRTVVLMRLDHIDFNQ